MNGHIFNSEKYKRYCLDYSVKFRVKRKYLVPSTNYCHLKLWQDSLRALNYKSTGSLETHLPVLLSLTRRGFVKP